jgi:hypothetical protein
VRLHPRLTRRAGGGEGACAGLDYAGGWGGWTRSPPRAIAPRGTDGDRRRPVACQLGSTLVSAWGASAAPATVVRHRGVHAGRPRHLAGAAACRPGVVLGRRAAQQRGVARVARLHPPSTARWAHATPRCAGAWA